MQEFEQDVRDQKSPRLLIEAPPRHTKSELGSRRYPAWVLGRNPNWQIIQTAYAAELAVDFGADVRDIIGEPEYQQVFDTRVSPYSSAGKRWHTTEGGVYIAAGVGGGITGRGAHIGIIDDPVKNREEADSAVDKRKKEKWYTSTFYSRLMPGGGVLMILTRWAEDDLAGYASSREDFRNIKLPAFDDEDRALWPEWYDKRSLLQIKKVMPPRDWSALYMQNPTPDEGLYFKPESFKRFELGEQPELLHYYLSSDYAVTEDEQADFTELGVWGYDSNGEWWLVDYYYEQAEVVKWIPKFIDFLKKYSVLKAFGERGVIMRATQPLIKLQMVERDVYTSLEWITRTKDKIASASAFRGLAELGRIHIPNTDWGERLIKQLHTFPAGAHDDAVDQCSLLGMAVDQGLVANPPAEAEQPLYPSDFRPKRNKRNWRTL